MRVISRREIGLVGALNTAAIYALWADVDEPSGTYYTRGLYASLRDAAGDDVYIDYHQPAKGCQYYIDARRASLSLLFCRKIAYTSYHYYIPPREADVFTDFLFPSRAARRSH